MHAIPIPDFSPMINQFIDTSLKTAAAILTALKHRDTHTESHSNRVAQLAWCLGLQMDLTQQELKTLVSAAVLHDVGKIGIPDSILLHDGPLNIREQEIIRTHSQIGQSIVEKLDLTTAVEVSQLVRWHHERIDGNGYPDGLKGPEIPLSARIISVVDAYDALTSTRTYRLAMNKEAALRELMIDQEVRFGEDVITALRDVLQLDDPLTVVRQSRLTL